MVTNQGEEAEKLSKERRSLWISAISRDDLSEQILANDRVCGRHFVSGKAAKSWDRFNTDWVPTLNLGHEKRVKRKNLEQASQRGQRANEKERKRKEQLDRERALAEEIAAKKLKLNEAGEQVSSICFTNEVEQSVDSSTQTEEFDCLVNTAPLPLQPFGKEEFRCDDKKVQFYTRLPSFDILNIVFHRIVPFVNRKSQLLTPFEEFIMTIMKLKLNMPLKILLTDSMFVSTVSRTFQAWMIVMDCRLQPFIKWPEREALWHTMPQCFQQPFGKKVTVIIDCFEIFIDRPSNLLARAQTFSSYNNNNNLLIGCSITRVV